MSLSTKNTMFIDGANVAYGSGNTFSVTGLLRCAVYFRRREFATKIILNNKWRAIAASGRLADGDQLRTLEASNIISYTPVGTNDKEFLVQLAYSRFGIIVSNDGLEKVKEIRPDLAHFISERRLPFRFENHEFVPLPPTIGGLVVEVDDFLRSPYNPDCVLSSAAALTDYLLTAKLDDDDYEISGDGRVSGNLDHGDYQHVRAIPAEEKPFAPPQRRYLVGTIADVSADTACIEFSMNDDKNMVWGSFDRNAYHPHGRAVSDLRREFHAGDWIAFISEKRKSEMRSHWQVIEVKKKGETLQGYGRFKPRSKEATLGIIEPRYKCASGGGDVFFPGAAFRETGVHLQKLERGQWLYYYALNQKPSAGCTAVAVEVVWAAATGVIVKKTGSNVFVWSVKLGLACGDLVSFPEGTWVQFRFHQRGSQLIASNITVTPLPLGVTIDTDQSRDFDEAIINVRCPGVIGAVNDTSVSIWTESFGRMSLTGDCLKCTQNLEESGLLSYQPVRIWAVYNTGDNEQCGGSGVAAAASQQIPSSKGEAWQIMNCIVTSVAEEPYPPSSIIFDVDAAVMNWENKECSERGQHWILMSEKYGKIFATPLDLVDTGMDIHIGGRVKVSIVPQTFPYGNEFRAVLVEPK